MHCEPCSSLLQPCHMSGMTFNSTSHLMFWIQDNLIYAYIYILYISIGILIIKIRQLWDYLIFIMRIPIPVRHHFEMAHRLSRHTSNRISKLFITGSQCGEISPVVSPHKWPIMQISFLCDSIIMTTGLRSSGVWMLTHQSMAFESHTRLFHSPNISVYCGPSQQQTSGSGILVQFYHAPRFLLWR